MVGDDKESTRRRHSASTEMGWVKARRADLARWWKSHRFGRLFLIALAVGVCGVALSAPFVWRASSLAAASPLAMTVFGAGLAAVVMGAVGVGWPYRFARNLNRKGQYAPVLRHQWLDVAGAVVVALAFEWVLFGLLGTHDDVSNWTWPWIQVQALNGEESSLVQPAIALLTPVVALVTATFAYRNATIRLAESQRADVAAFQQRFIDGARLLADPNAHTRVAGAIALGSLARDWVENRQEVVDVMCGYLRTKPTAAFLTEPGEPGDQHGWHGSEDIVRTALVEQLARTLRESSDSLDRGEGITVNLDGAWFADANFRDLTFDQEASFRGARFTRGADFGSTTFNRFAIFKGVVFSDQVNFWLTTFIQWADFRGATFAVQANFRGATFTQPAWFESAKFTHAALFQGVDFKLEANFSAATFTQTWRSTAQPAPLERQALGPLEENSQEPDPPGNVVDDGGVVVGEAQWFRSVIVPEV